MSDILQKIIPVNEFNNGGAVVQANISTFPSITVDINKETFASDSGVLDTRLDDKNYYFGAPPAATGTITGDVGATDNAVLRADGSKLQAASWIMPDNYTAAPNATVNACVLQASGATANVAAVISPVGSGPFIVGAAPDGTATGGNARGVNAVDLQTVRLSANEVANGEGAFAAGRHCRSSSTDTVAIGRASLATGFGAVAMGGGAATGGGSIALGYQSSCSSSFGTAIGAYSVVDANFGFAGPASTVNGDHATAFGPNSLADRYGMRAFAAGYFTYAQKGEAQSVGFTLRNRTVDATATELYLNGGSVRLTIPSGKILHATVHLIGSKSDGSAIAIYQRQVAIANVGGTTSLVGAVNTIGSDTAAGTSLSITADNTNDSLKIEVTGIAAETWRWVASVSGSELAYGT